jgi:hypothetical protein
MLELLHGEALLPLCQNFLGHLKRLSALARKHPSVKYVKIHVDTRKHHQPAMYIRTGTGVSLSDHYEKLERREGYDYTLL